MVYWFFLELGVGGENHTYTHVLCHYITISHLTYKPSDLLKLLRNERFGEAWPKPLNSDPFAASIGISQRYFLIVRPIHQRISVWDTLSSLQIIRLFVKFTHNCSALMACLSVLTPPCTLHIHIRNALSVGCMHTLILNASKHSAQRFSKRCIKRGI